MKKMNGLFVEVEGTAKKGTRALDGTAELKAAASQIVDIVLDGLSNNFDDNAELFEDSKTNAASLDKLINKFAEDFDVDFLSNYDEDTINGMLKSQQSKRSRAKSKTMTMDNYTAMMNAAVSEMMIRKYIGKPKSSRGFGGGGGVEYTIDYVQSLGENQHELRRELRNIQSKQCIMRKNNPDDYEMLESYQELEKVASMLKELRQPIETHRVKMSDVTAVLQGIDLKSLKKDDAIAILAELMELTGVVDNEEPATETVAEVEEMEAE